MALHMIATSSPRTRGCPPSRLGPIHLARRHACRPRPSARASSSTRLENLMTAPSVTVNIQPYANSKLVYLPMAPLTPSSKPKGRLMVELTLINNSGSTLTATAANFSFPTGTVAGDEHPPDGGAAGPLHHGHLEHAHHQQPLPVRPVHRTDDRHRLRLLRRIQRPGLDHRPRRPAHRTRQDRPLPVPLQGLGPGAGRVLAVQRLHTRPRLPPMLRLRHERGRCAARQRPVLTVDRRREPVRAQVTERQLPHLRQAGPGHGRR